MHAKHSEALSLGQIWSQWIQPTLGCNTQNDFPNYCAARLFCSIFLDLRPVKRSVHQLDNSPSPGHVILILIPVSAQHVCGLKSMLVPSHIAIPALLQGLDFALLLVQSTASGHILELGTGCDRRVFGKNEQPLNCYSYYAGSIFRVTHVVMP